MESTKSNKTVSEVKDVVIEQEVLKDAPTEGQVYNCLAVNVRKEGSRKAEVLGTLSKDSKVSIVKELKKWYKVVTEHGIEGYIDKDYIEVI